MQMLPDVAGAHGVLPLELKPAHSVGHLLVQHLDEPEQETEGKGGIQEILAQHMAKLYKGIIARDMLANAA